MVTVLLIIDYYVLQNLVHLLLFLAGAVLLYHGFGRREAEEE